MVRMITGLVNIIRQGNSDGALPLSKVRIKIQFPLNTF